MRHLRKLWILGASYPESATPASLQPAANQSCKDLFVLSQVCSTDISNWHATTHWCAMNGLQMRRRSLGEDNSFEGPLRDVSRVSYLPNCPKNLIVYLEKFSTFSVCHESLKKLLCVADYSLLYCAPFPCNHIVPK